MNVSRKVFPVIRNPILVPQAALTTLYWTWPAKARLPYPAGILSGYSVVGWIYFLSVRLRYHLIA